MEISAELRLRHAIVVRARKARGWNQRKLAEEAGISWSTASRVERLQFKMPHVREAALKIAVVLGLPPDEVLPPDMEENIIAEHRVTKHIAPQVLLACASRIQDRLILPSPYDEAVANELSETMIQALSTLTPREREVIEMRYGLNGRHTHTLEDCARHFKRSREQMRQDEVRAIRKLQCPVRARKLAEFLGTTDDDDG